MQSIISSDEEYGTDTLTPVAIGYGQIASEYAARIADELAGKPLDRALLRAYLFARKDG